MFAKYKDVVYQCAIVAIGCAIFGAGLDLSLKHISETTRPIIIWYAFI